MTGKKKVTVKEGKKWAIETVRQPKVRMQIMIPYHLLQRIEALRGQDQKVNDLLQSLLIIGLKSMESVKYKPLDGDQQ